MRPTPSETLINKGIIESQRDHLFKLPVFRELFLFLLFLFNENFANDPVIVLCQELKQGMVYILLRTYRKIPTTPKIMLGSQAASQGGKLP